MTILEAHTQLFEKLQKIYNASESSLIARYIFEDLIDLNITSEGKMTEQQQSLLDDATDRLIRYEPWQYISGKADFYGRQFLVNTSVLIPRPETEELVEHALDYIKNRNDVSILDIGTGSGIIPVTIRCEHPSVNATAVDISEAALSVAAHNARMHNAQVEFEVMDFLNPEEWQRLGKYDLVVSNPPYISLSEKETMDANVIAYEPHIALFADPDPLIFYKAIAGFVLSTQNENTIVLTEIHEKYGKAVLDIFIKSGFRNVKIVRDMQGKDRIVTAEK